MVRVGRHNTIIKTTIIMAQHIAVHAFTEKAEGLLEPLLEEDEGSSTSSSSSDEESNYSTSTVSTVSVKVKQTPSQMLKTAAGK